MTGSCYDGSAAPAIQGGLEIYTLRLYVAGPSARGHEALSNLRKICRDRLQGRCHIEVVDLKKNPQRAREDQILAIPTLIRESLPGRRVVGDLSDADRVLAGLDMCSTE